MQPTYIMENFISLKIATNIQMKKTHNVNNKNGEGNTQK
jgi:hypothetical protein